MAPVRFLSNIQRGIDDAAQQIRLEGGRQIEMMDAAIYADEGILNNIFGKGFIVNNKKRRAHGL